MITGTLDIDAVESNSNNIPKTKVITIPYPSGLNENNCIVIACGIGSNNSYGTNYEGFNDVFMKNTNADDLLYSSYTRIVTLYSNGIRLAVKNYNVSKVTCSYKIILVKVS